MRKFACVLHYTVLLLWVAGLFAGGTVMDANAVFSTVVVYLTMVAGGIYFFVMEKADTLPPVQSFKLQGKLNSLAFLFTGLFFLYFLLSWQGTMYDFSADAAAVKSFTGNHIFDAFVFSLPYFILIIPYVAVISMSSSYNAAKKEFGVTAENADHIVAHGGPFFPVEGASDVMKNRDHLFFAMEKCFVPLDRIVEIEMKKTRLFGLLIDSSVMITTDKGRKLTVDTKDYEVLERELADYEYLFEH